MVSGKRLPKYKILVWNRQCVFPTIRFYSNSICCGGSKHWKYIWFVWHQFKYCRIITAGICVIIQIRGNCLSPIVSQSYFCWIGFEIMVKNCRVFCLYWTIYYTGGVFCQVISPIARIVLASPRLCASRSNYCRQDHQNDGRGHACTDLFQHSHWSSSHLFSPSNYFAVTLLFVLSFTPYADPFA